MRACVITDLCKGCFNVGVKRSGNGSQILDIATENSIW